jgi:hypothetical protein
MVKVEQVIVEQVVVVVSMRVINRDTPAVSREMGCVMIRVARGVENMSWLRLPPCASCWSLPFCARRLAQVHCRDEAQGCCAPAAHAVPERTKVDAGLALMLLNAFGATSIETWVSGRR